MCLPRWWRCHVFPPMALSSCCLACLVFSCFIRYPWRFKRREDLMHCIACSRPPRPSCSRALYLCLLAPSSPAQHSLNSNASPLCRVLLLSVSDNRTIICCLRSQIVKIVEPWMHGDRAGARRQGGREGERGQAMEEAGDNSRHR